LLSTTSNCSTSTFFTHLFKRPNRSFGLYGIKCKSKLGSAKIDLKNHSFKR
jgi:hypothetical protein